MRGKPGHHEVAGPSPSKSRASRWDKEVADAKLNPTATPLPANEGTGPSQNDLMVSPREAQTEGAEPPELNKPSVEPPVQESVPQKGVAEAQAVGPILGAFQRQSAVFVDPRTGSALAGFGMLEKRSITLGDGSVRTYYALPPDQSEPSPAGNNAVINPSFDSAPLGSRESIVAAYGQDNQYNVPENPHQQNSSWPPRGLQPNEAEYLARKAEENRFYSANPMAPPQSNSLGFGRREGPSAGGSISRNPYGNAGVLSSASAEFGNDANFPAGDPAAAGLRARAPPSAEEYPSRSFPPAAVGAPAQGSRDPLTPRRSQLSPRSGSRLSLQEIEYYGSVENALKRKYVEEEGPRDGLQRGFVDERDYMWRVREMELLEDRRRREQERAEFMREKYLEEEGLRQHGMYSSSSRPGHYENPHGGGDAASRLPPNDKSDFMHGPPAEPWISSSRLGTGDPSNWGRQDLHYKNDLAREMEDERNYQRPFKYQKQNDDQSRIRAGHRTDDDTLPKDGQPTRQSGLPEDSEEFKQHVHRAYLRFAKVLNENPGQRKRYQDEGKSGSLLCLVCSRLSKDYADTHSLVMHAYNSRDSSLREQHLGLHKALCVLMGWSYVSPPDDARSYQSLPSSEATANREDLILMPPLVIIHNAYTRKRKDGRWEGIGNKDMDGQLKELGFSSGKSKAVYGKDGHQGIVVVKFSPTLPGFQEAERLVKYFEDSNHGRKDWLRVQSSHTDQQNDDENPDLIQMDEKTKTKKRVLYGYMATAGDLEKVDFDTRKKALVKSRKDMDTTADGPVEEE